MLATFVTTFVSQIFILQWLRYGDPSMYVAMVACAFYFALYFPTFLLMCRGAVHRLRVPMVIAAPVIWVGLEYLRAYMLTGASWYYIGHTQYRWLEMIQVSDLVGAYGVSFVVMTAAAALAGILPAWWLAPNSIPASGTAANTESEAAMKVMVDGATASTGRVRFRDGMAVAYALVVVGGCLTYGYVRRARPTFAKVHESRSFRGTSPRP